MLRESLAPSRVDGLFGILNGTTNFVLTSMSESGADYGAALAEVQRRYLEVLDEAGVWDKQTARRVALQRGEVQSSPEILLVAAADLNRVQRLFLDQIGKIELPDHYTADLRMREEFRWLPDGFSMRLRPGLLARRPAKIGDYMLTPFVGTEIFWDTRFNRVTNVRFTAGANLPVLMDVNLIPTGATLADGRPVYSTSVSAAKVSSGWRSRRMLRCRRALLSVANCRPL